MFAFLKAPANAPLITDKQEVDARYRYWRRHILTTIWLGYALFYFTRKSFNAAVPDILTSGVLTRSDIGLLATLFYITYGLSKFVSGIVSDRSNARYFMGIGLIATGVVNILFGFSTSLWAFAVLWALNAFFQGWGSPVCARLLTAWYSRTERGGWWALWNTAHNVGGALIPIVMAATALHYGWRAGMMIAGLLAIVVGVFLCWRLRDRPQAIGLPPIGDWRHDELEIAQQQEGAGLSRKEILTRYVLLNPYIWLLSLCYVLVYVVRAAINDWGNLYMSETLGVDLVTANTAVTMFELGGFVGALVAGWGSDKLLNGTRGPLNLSFAADADRHGGSGVFAQRGGRCSNRFCWSVCLSGGIALRLAAGEGDGGLALDRVFCGDRHCGGDFRAAAAAVFKRPGSARSQRSVMHLTFLP